jgi:hypothetical protein
MSAKRPLPAKGGAFFRVTHKGSIKTAEQYQKCHAKTCIDYFLASNYDMSVEGRRRKTPLPEVRRQNAFF